MYDKNNNFEIKLFKNGDKVKIRYDQIKERKNYNERTYKFKKWIEENKNKVFTVELDEKYKNGFLICLKEDNTDPKWLFFCYDLEEV